MRIFFDTEFTGLHKCTTLISIGCISEDGRQFYAECMDYNKYQNVEWIKEHVEPNLEFKEHGEVNTVSEHKKKTVVHGFTWFVGRELYKWLSQFDQAEMWGDVLPYDWVIFCDLLQQRRRGAKEPLLPKCLSYIPFDIATLFQLRGVDPDINRQVFCGYEIDDKNKHHALYDALVIMKCFELLYTASFPPYFPKHGK